MARQQLGQADAADQWLAKADQWLATVNRTSLNALPTSDVQLRVRLVFPLLREEARRQMGK